MIETLEEKLNWTKKSNFLEIFKRSKLPKSIYIYGEVGRGKTFLMDLFFKEIPSKKKLRLHFHRFMQLLHDDLNQLKGQTDPINKIVKKLTKKYSFFCFDEFFVEDIGDAMLLGKFMQEFFKSNACFVTTSNIEPSRLYEGGLQRKLFLPAIESIEQNCELYNLDSKNDYRFRTLEQNKLFFYPLSNEVENNLEEIFKSLIGINNVKLDEIEILQRKIPTVKSSKGVVWFEFNAICKSPRSSMDYIEISKEFQTIIISNMFKMESDDIARRFISLIDECYDRKVKLIISAEEDFKDIYRGLNLKEKYKRTISRLIEMQSTSYLKEAHKA